MSFKRTLLLVLLFIIGCNPGSIKTNSTDQEKPPSSSPGFGAEPVDIPVTIAKVEIDPFSVRVISSDSGNVLVGSLQVEACESEAVVEAAVPEKNIFLSAVTEDCRFQIPLTGEVKGSVIALGIQTEEPTVFVEVRQDGTAIVFTAPSEGVMTAQFALKPSGEAVYCASRESGTALEYKNLSTGELTLVAEGLPRCPDLAGFSKDSLIVFNGGEIAGYSPSSEGAWVASVLGSTTAAEPSLAIGPGGELAFFTSSGVMMNGTEWGMEEADNQILDWKDGSHLMMFQKFAGFSQFKEIPSDESAAILFNSDCRELSCNGSGDCFAACQEEGKWSLFGVTEEVKPLLPGQEVQHLSTCESGVVFEGGGEILFYSMGTVAASGLKGSFPQCLEESRVSFICPTLVGPQICLHDFKLAGGIEPTRFALTGPVQAAKGECAGPFVITATDNDGIERNVQKDIELALSTGSGAFYADSACSEKAENPVMFEGTSRLTFYFKDNNPETLLLKVSGTLEPASLPFTVTALTASRLAVTGPSEISVGTCALYTVTAQDDMGGAAAVLQKTTVSLSGAGSGAFYASPSCQPENLITQVLIQNKATTTQFYFKNPALQSVVLTADDAGEMSAGSIGVTVR